MDELCTGRFFLGFFDGNATYLTPFSLASTYSTLPSPTNLKRWRITTGTKCTLCSKDVCTTANCNLNDPSKETCNSPFSLSSLKQTIKPVSNTKLTHPVGFTNKGNTYYANSILQVLIVVPNLWNRVPSESNTLLPMLQAISLNMAVKKNSTKYVDPSNFLWTLKPKLSIMGEVSFHYNTQQDVAEILLVVLDELKGISIAARHLICNTQKISFL